ncbi:MAG TPA: ABC transporter permease [Solirubrobacteraceae bacterium]|jgi:peptide/nickel transport system permease protein|nr:ABC transporter permease [Solirubrobacteraceae bacterium]
MSTPAITAGAAPAAPPSMRQRQWSVLLRATLRQWRARIGLAIFVIMVLIALVGPLLAPHSPNVFVSAPNSPAGQNGLLFGADSLGRDVWSRFLHGGGSVLGMSLAATLIGVGLGLVVGLTAAYLGGVTDEVLMRISDVFMAFPQIVLALLLVTAFGPSVGLIILIVGVSTAPRVARVIRGAALQVVERDFVKAAEAVGEPRRRIIFGELLPNVTSPLLVEVGLRLTYSIGLIAALNFLGDGIQPPAADWGVMINENRLAVSVQPWGVLLPVLAIALLTIGSNLLTDGFARAAIGLDRGE